MGLLALVACCRLLLIQRHIYLVQKVLLQSHDLLVNAYQSLNLLLLDFIAFLSHVLHVAVQLLDLLAILLNCIL